MPKKSSIRQKNIRKKSDCMALLKDKISKNISEYKDGIYASRQQAIAVSYSQVKKMSPYCSRYMKRSSRKISRKVSRKSSQKRSRKISQKRSRKISQKRSRKISQKRSRKISRKVSRKTSRKM